MATTREKKKKILEELKEKIEKQKIIVFVDFKGLKVSEFFDLRKRLKEIGDEIKVVKKTLANLTLGKKFNFDVKSLKGQLALIFGFRDEIAPAKIAFEFSQSHSNLKILGGILEGKFIEKEKVEELAKLPKREEILANLVLGLKSPILNFVEVLRGNLKSLIFVLCQIQSKVAQKETK